MGRTSSYLPAFLRALRMIQLLRGITVLFGAIGLCGQCVTAEPPLNFNRDVRPILSDKCFACHGQDANKRELTCDWMWRPIRPVKSSFAQAGR